MKHLFVPYELALLAKEKGFNDRGIIAIWRNDKDQNPEFCDKIAFGWSNNDFKQAVGAPIYQQLVDWFREKHDIHFHIRPVNEIHPNPQFLGYADGFNENIYHKTYYEALNSALNEAFKLL